MGRLAIEKLKVLAGEKEILHGVSLVVEEGETHVVMGPNGSGKSTLAYAIAGHPFYKISGGTVRIKDGRKETDLLEMEAAERARAGIFLGFQNPVAIAGVSIFQLLKTARDARRTEGGKSESITEYYERLKGEAKGLGLSEEFLKRGVNEGFSGGERKKAEVLQLLDLRPRFALLDEPDTGLDVDALKVVAKGIAASAELGTGILLITHYNRILKFLKPKKVTVLKDGRVVKSGGLEVTEEVEERGYGAIE